ncbi:MULTISPECIES: DUF2975 domain-containing protein [unclassified Lysinibacillus]|uniref:DUF2975 domain-containing protein n=1 Tax=unclassified Lysinibacillus TaxID=2636778 RepID=UPI0023304EE0|nr:DUF2975 domain-containing protein [Lysinibacillus sp. OF-1]WCH49638.1 DUF2975 domain-containing protein [Lysinibacillus sp. OF-1]
MSALCVPYYITLYRLLINTDQHKAFSASSVKALRTIKYCAFTIVLFLALALQHLSSCLLTRKT